MQPFERIEALRLSGAVRRLHCHRVLFEQNVAEHSWGVACIIDAFWPDQGDLLRAALYHDVGEHHTGDMPAPVKWEHPKLASYLKEVESLAVDKIGVGVKLSDENQLRLKIADSMEFLLHCLEQKDMGHRALDGPIGRITTYLTMELRPRLAAINDLAFSDFDFMLNDCYKRWKDIRRD